MSLPELQQNPLVQRVIDIFDTDGNGEVDFKGTQQTLQVFLQLYSACVNLTCFKETATLQCVELTFGISSLISSLSATIHRASTPLKKRWTGVLCHHKLKMHHICKTGAYEACCFEFKYGIILSFEAHVLQKESLTVVSAERNSI